MENKIITHPLKPIFDENSAVLILGTMPSPNQEKIIFIMDTHKIDFGEFYQLFLAKNFLKIIKSELHFY